MLNFYGHDADPALGSQAVNFPYKLTIPHDGSFQGIVIANFHRFYYSLQIWVDQYSLRHNLYRSGLYLILYGSVLLYLYSCFRKRIVEKQLITLILLFSYVVLLFSVVGFEERYFSPIDFFLNIMLATVVAGCTRRLVKGDENQAKAHAD